MRFDDIAALQGLVSDDYGPWGAPVQVDQAMIDAFAELSGDRSWIHVDPARCARESPAKACIAHGLLLLSLVPKLVASEDDVSGFGQRLFLGLDAVRFRAPVVVGSRVRGRKRLRHVRKKGLGGSQLRFEVEVEVAEAQRVALSCEMRVALLP